MDEYDLPPRLVTDALVSDLASGKITGSDVGATIPGIDSEKQQQFLFELCEAYCNDNEKFPCGQPSVLLCHAEQGKLALDKFFEGVKAAGLNGDINTDLAHAIWFHSLKPGKAEALGELAGECIKKNKLTKRAVLELEEPAVMAFAGLVTNENVWNSKERKVLTNLYYKQDKYNLLREENEGYGKLLTALLSGGTLQQQHLPALTREIKALIGAFKLDPNRVCDLVLDAAERDEVGVDVWLQLMSLFNKEAPKQMLAMKFLHYVQDHRHLSAGDDDSSGKAVEQQRKAPPSLYSLAAAMIKARHISLEDLLSYLSPTAESLATSYKEVLEKLQTEVKELSQATLGGTDAGSTAAADAGTAAGTGGRRALLTGSLDTIAKDRGITDDINQGFGSRGGAMIGPPGMGMQQMMQPGVPPGMWQRGMAPPGHPMGGPPGPMGPGGYTSGGGMYGGAQNGPMGGQGMMMGSTGMRGGSSMPTGGAGPGGAMRAGGGGSSEAYAASYNVMPASQLELDARAYDKPLLDGTAGHVQLLLALMKLGDWEHAMLLLDYLQNVLGIQVTSNTDVSKAILLHLQKLLDPVYKALYPKGVLCGSVLRRHPYNLDDGVSLEAALNPVFPAALNPPGPALEPLAYQMLGYLGVYVYRNPEVLVMLLRVLKHELMFYGRMWPLDWEQGLQQVDAQKVAQVAKVLAENAFPALALSPANRALSAELWSVLELMPFHDRAEVYREALAACTASPPAAAAGQLAVKAFKKVKARLALPDKADKSRKDIIKANANLLSKVSHATPLQVADQMMWWAASAPNSVEPLAEVLKLPNPLTQDALTYQVLYWWGRLGKSKMKEDGANEEDWVAGLADLVGYACRAHPHHSFNLSIILGFLFDELKAGETLSVLLLRCILSKMAAIDGPVSLDPSQAKQLCAGHIMQAESIHSVANRAEPRFLKGRRALVEVLQEGSEAQQLLVPLAVVMSQHLDWALYALHTKHLKELAELHDRVNEITQQYLMVLEHCISKDKTMPLKEYARALPPMDSLINEYGVHPGIAWMIWRPVVAALEPQLMAKLEANAAAAAAAGDEGDDPDMLSLLATDTRPSAAASKVGSGDGEEGELPEEGEAMQGLEGPGAEVKEAAAAAAAAAAAVAAAAVDLPVTLADVTASVQKLNLEIFTVLTEPFYVAFWSLRPDEIHVPTDLYDARITEMENFIKAGPKEISGLQNGIDTENRLLDGLRHRRLPPREHEMQYNRCIDNLTAKQNSLAEAKQKLEHCQALIGPLKEERDALVTRHKQVMQRLQAEKDQYVQLKQTKMVYKQLCYSFIRSCMVPRLTRSVADAVFCHHFIMTLHKIDTPNWPAAFIWDYTVTSLASMIPTVTEKEALCVGVFLTLLLQTLQVWYFDEAAYKRNCSQQTMRQSVQNAAPFSHEQFVKLFNKWQNSLFKNLKACANSNEYLQKRNALTIMSKMIQAASDDQPPMFPFYKHHSESMQTVMKDIQENDPRQDVKKMAQALFIQLTNTLDRSVAASNKGKQQVRAPAGKRPVGAPTGRKPPVSPAKQQQQPGSRPATPPPAAAEVKPDPGAAAAAGKAGEGQADKPPAAAAAAGGGGGSSAKPAAGTAAAAAGGGGPKAVRKGPGPPAAVKQAAVAAAASAGGGGSGTPGSTGNTKPPRHGGTGGGAKAAAAAAADDQPARKRARVAPTSSKAEDGGGAAAAGEEEPGEVPDTTAAAAAPAASEGTAAKPGSKAAAPAAATPGEKKASPDAAAAGKGGDSASKAKQCVAQRAVKKAVAPAAAAGDNKGGAKPAAKPAQQQQGKDATPEQKQQQPKQDEHKQQHKHDGDRHATPERSRHHPHHDKQQQGREEKESGAKQQQRDGSRDRGGQQDDDEGKGSRRSRRGDRDGTSDRGEKGSSRDGSGKQQQQRESDADGAAREQQPAQQREKEKEGREKERKRDRREQKGDKQQRDDRRERGSEERAASRDNSTEPAKRRRVEDEQQQQPERQSARQQQERNSGSGHKQEQQQQSEGGQQQQQQRRTKHAPIMPPPDRPARKDSSEHERGGDERPHGRGRR